MDLFCAPGMGLALLLSFGLSSNLVSASSITTSNSNSIEEVSPVYSKYIIHKDSWPGDSLPSPKLYYNENGYKGYLYLYESTHDVMGRTTYAEWRGTVYCEAPCVVASEIME